MKILVVCQHFYPENFRINDLTFELAKRGHDITVLTGLPNYPEGKVLKEYKSFKNRKQVFKNVKIERCSLIGRGDSLFMMALNYFWFACFGSLKAFKLKGKFDLVYVYQLSPVTMAWPAIVMKKRKKIPLIIHCLDQWPISVTTGPISKTSLIYKLLYNISVWTYKKADLITVSSQSFVDYFEKELKITQHEKGLVYCPSYAESEYEKTERVDNEIFDIVFAGNIGPAQSCETIIKCAEILKGKQDIKFHLVGDGLSRKNCEDLVQKKQLKNVVFYGFHDISEMPRFYGLADCFVITMVDNQVVNSTLPAKLQSYMLAGKPIYGAIGGEVRKVVEEANCGECVESGNAKGLATIISNSYKEKKKLDKWGLNGLQYYKDHFEKELCINKLENIFIAQINENKVFHEIERKKNGAG
ncbi:MAG: glycosyltransferase family 4 protein [Lachnospiraceae bacterium]